MLPARTEVRVRCGSAVGVLPRNWKRRGVAISSRRCGASRLVRLMEAQTRAAYSCYEGYGRFHSPTRAEGIEYVCVIAKR